jgi:hypothetical protein
MPISIVVGMLISPSNSSARQALDQPVKQPRQHDDFQHQGYPADQ